MGHMFSPWCIGDHKLFNIFKILLNSRFILLKLYHGKIWFILDPAETSFLLWLLTFQLFNVILGEPLELALSFKWHLFIELSLVDIFDCYSVLFFHQLDLFIARLNFLEVRSWNTLVCDVYWSDVKWIHMIMIYFVQC